MFTCPPKQNLWTERLDFAARLNQSFYMGDVVMTDADQQVAGAVQLLETLRVLRRDAPAAGVKAMLTELKRKEPTCPLGAKEVRQMLQQIDGELNASSTRDAESSEPITASDIEAAAPIPPKLSKDASPEERARRAELMKLRQQMQKRMHEQQRVRDRPSNDEERERRAVQRCLKDAHALVAELGDTTTPKLELEKQHKRLLELLEDVMQHTGPLADGEPDPHTPHICSMWNDTMGLLRYANAHLEWVDVASAIPPPPPPKPIPPPLVTFGHEPVDEETQTARWELFDAMLNTHDEVMKKKREMHGLR